MKLVLYINFLIFLRILFGSVIDKKISLLYAFVVLDQILNNKIGFKKLLTVKMDIVDK